MIGVVQKFSRDAAGMTVSFNDLFAIMVIGSTDTKTDE